jgi:hypothetical protein
MRQKRERKRAFVRGEQFEDVQDSRPEEIVTVEALAVSRTELE